MGISAPTMGAKEIIGPYPTMDQTGPGKEVAQMMVRTSREQLW